MVFIATFTAQAENKPVITSDIHNYTHTHTHTYNKNINADYDEFISQSTFPSIERIELYNGKTKGTKALGNNSFIHITLSNSNLFSLKTSKVFWSTNSETLQKVLEVKNKRLLRLPIQLSEQENTISLTLITIDNANNKEKIILEDLFQTISSIEADTDLDGQPDIVDLDDDNDGYQDARDSFPYDPEETTDSDADGVGDNGDAFPLDPAAWQDRWVD